MGEGRKERRAMDDGRHAPAREIDYVASAIVGKDVERRVCQCGAVTGDLQGHLAHADAVLHVPGPGWLPVGGRVALLLSVGLGLLGALLAVAETQLAGTARTVLLALAAPAAFGVTMGLAVALRGFIVPLRPARR
ncbi:hypothetical protein P3T27_007975 [Kitasatospora sp. MAA19]|uniref:hypothetical protein n=1 Tax=unclassified Kitasatospora TaxID=2633591 RepID=UPI00247552A1|nr:hypothetical protein [Kitasatospora sp. MAA19]MDH6711222.1 hypothetical protein [Kitasatospora sp. MAA19]